MMLNKLANELTDEAVKKEEFFKFVKKVVSKGIFNKMIDAKNSIKHSGKEFNKEIMKKKLAQLKFIQKCKEENVLALPMLNRMKDKKLVLENYRMNEGISKALQTAIMELSDHIEIIFLKSNDINDQALSSIINGVLENKYI